MVKERETGLDLLRILAMFMVVVWHAHDFHFQGYGLPSLDCDHPISYIFVRTYQVFGVDGVNVFALLTGYLCIRTKWHADRYARLWLQAAFFGLGFYALWWALWGTGVMEQGPVMKTSVVFQLVCPLGVGIYWYVVAYTGLFFLIPFINKGLMALNKRQWLLLVLASVGISITVGWKNQELASFGYSTFWLCSLYVLGAYLRIHQPKNRPLVYGAILILFLATKAALYIFHIKSCIIYSSPFDVTEAVMWLLLLRNVKVKNVLAVKLISWLSIGSFGVYLVHTHPFVIHLLRLSISVFDLNHPGEMWWIVPVWSICLYLACILVDQVRIWLFALCRFKQLGTWLTNTGTGIIDRALPWMGAPAPDARKLDGKAE